MFVFWDSHSFFPVSPQRHVCLFVFRYDLCEV
jgi:hypothetical protein